MLLAFFPWMSEGNVALVITPTKTSLQKLTLSASSESACFCVFFFFVPGLSVVSSIRYELRPTHFKSRFCFTTLKYIQLGKKIW